MSLANFLASLTSSSAPSAAPSPAAIAAPPASAPSPAPAAGLPGGQSTAVGAAPAAAPVDPLAAWGDLFKPAAAPPAGSPAPATPVDLFSVNPEALAKAAANINLSSVIAPELVQKALGGDAASFMEVINKSTQMAFMMAHQASMQGVKPAMEARFSDFSKEMPSTFKKLSVDATLQGDPLLSNPAMAPVVASLRSSIMSKHPDATPQQVQQAISEYLKTVGITVAAPAKANAVDTKTGSSAVVDWDNFLK